MTDRSGESEAPAFAAVSPAGLDLAELRSRIDVLDRELVRLLNERAQLGIAAGRIKRRMGRAVPDPGREAQVLTRVAMANEGPFPDDTLAVIYREIMRAIVELEELDEAVAALREEHDERRDGNGEGDDPQGR